MNIYRVEGVCLMSKLSDEQVHVYLRKLPGWRYEDSAIKKTFEFERFSDSIAFVNEIAKLAEESNHHPDLAIRYNRVEVLLTTHDKGDVTGKDFMLAEQIQKIT